MTKTYSKDAEAVARSLRFVPVDQLEAEGYGAYRHLFDQTEATA